MITNKEYQEITSLITPQEPHEKEAFYDEDWDEGEWDEDTWDKEDD